MSQRGSKGPKGQSITLEALFSSHGDGIPQEGYPLTPRSAQAILQTGVDPDNLRLRDIDTFDEPGLDQTRLGMRYEAYNDRRKRSMTLLRETMKQLAADKRARERNPAAVDGSISPIDREQAAAQSSTALLQEQKKLAKTMAKQQKEMRKVQQFEQRMKEVARQEKLKQKEEAKKRAQDAKESLLRAKQAEKEAKERQQKAKELAEIEEAERKEMMRLEFEKEQQLEARFREEELGREREMQEAELDRQRKAEEHRLKTERILEEQEQERRRAEERMEQNEKKRQLMMEQKSTKRAEELQVARARLQKKKDDNAEMNSHIEEARRNAFMEREKGAHERQQRMLEMMESDRTEQRRFSEEQEQKRIEKIQNVKKRDQNRVELLQARQVAVEQNVRQLQAQAVRENELKSERFLLKAAATKAKVQQQERVDLYRRQQTKQKLDIDMARADKMKWDLARMLEERKLAAIEIKRKQEQIKASVGAKWYPS